MLNVFKRSGKSFCLEIKDDSAILMDLKIIILMDNVILSYRSLFKG